MTVAKLRIPEGGPRRSLLASAMLALAVAMLALAGASANCLRAITKLKISDGVLSLVVAMLSLWGEGVGCGGCGGERVGVCWR